MWQEYRELDWARVHELMDVPVIVDERNFLDPDVMRSSGFEYVDMGRNHMVQPEGSPAEGVRWSLSAASAKVAATR